MTTADTVCQDQVQANTDKAARYHVKADRPHQDTRGLLKTSARTMWRQGSQGTDAREKG